MSEWIQFKMLEKSQKQKGTQASDGARERVDNNKMEG